MTDTERKSLILAGISARYQDYKQVKKMSDFPIWEIQAETNFSVYFIITKCRKKIAGWQRQKKERQMKHLITAFFHRSLRRHPRHLRGLRVRMERPKIDAGRAKSVERKTRRNAAGLVDTAGVKPAGSSDFAHDHRAGERREYCWMGGRMGG
jgi:hypothetical protein